MSTLVEVFEACTRKGSVVYVASKTYYFGVGGGTKALRDEIVNKRAGLFEWSTELSTETGVKREVIKLTRI